MASRWLLVLSAVAACTSTSPPAEAQACGDDAACAPDEMCFGLRCVACFRDAHCDCDQQCRDFSCEPLDATTAADRCAPEPLECAPPAPPAALAAVCPSAPRHREGCAPGTWCSPLGRCVQCLCDADCPGELFCHGPTRRCLSPALCRENGECPAGESCDGLTGLCRRACDGDNQCQAVIEYCDTEDDVCRAWSERACLPDAQETAGNDDAAAAVACGSDCELPLPELGGELAVQSTLCEEDVDWYTVPLAPGDRLVVVPQSPVPGFEAELQLRGPDAMAVLATGRSEYWFDLDFTASQPMTAFLRVAPFGTDYGLYNLQVYRTVGEFCADSFEWGNGDNDYPADATPLNPPAAPLPTACVLLSGALAGAHAITCENLSLCQGDVDYFLAYAPAGSSLTIGLRDYSFANVDLLVYGPFAPTETPVADNAVLAGASTSIFATETVTLPVAADGTYLVEVVDSTISQPSYVMDLEVEL